MAKKLIMTESQFNQLITNQILTEQSVNDIVKSREFEKCIKDAVETMIKNNKNIEKDIEKIVKKVVGKSVSELFKVLWQKRNFYENDF